MSVPSIVIQKLRPSLQAPIGNVPGPWHGDAFNIASNYARLGEIESALEWLERAYEMRSGLLIWLSVHFHFDALRQDPRFEELLRRIGLASGG